MDRDVERQLRASLEQFGAPGERYAIDGVGPAIYRLEPSWLTTVLCLRCQFVTLKVGLPKLLRQTFVCGSCGKPIGLEPPAEVLGARLPVGRPA